MTPDNLDFGIIQSTGKGEMGIMLWIMILEIQTASFERSGKWLLSLTASFEEYN